MRFGGHETFPIREGWLHKGLKLLIEDPGLLVDDNAPDHLGVGQNMAKSIRHWLVGTGLAQSTQKGRGGKKADLEPTTLGRLVWKRDRYFVDQGTWWALHINLVNNPDHAASWTWFFNSFSNDRFDRPVCLESLARHLQLSKQRLPNNRTLARDISCLLATYSRPIPDEDSDPEDAHDCPFRELGLLSYFRSSGYYQLHRGPKSVPSELLGYAIAMSFPDAATGKGSVDIALHDATRQPGGPGKVFVLTGEALFSLAMRIEAESTERVIEITGLAGQRALRVPKKSSIEWLEQHYSLTRKRGRNVA